MSTKCAKCPCPDICVAKPAYCEWMRAEQPNEMHVRAIVANSRKHAGRFPSLPEMALYGAEALARLAVAGVQLKQVRASDELIAKRRAICNGCEFLKDSRCLKCGCFYEVKIRLATETCPIGLW
jgi:hypothetical protein